VVVVLFTVTALPFTLTMPFPSPLTEAPSLSENVMVMVRANSVLAMRSSSSLSVSTVVLPETPEVEDGSLVVVSQMFSFEHPHATAITHRANNSIFFITVKVKKYTCIQKYQKSGPQRFPLCHFQRIADFFQRIADYDKGWFLCCQPLSLLWPLTATACVFPDKGWRPQIQPLSNWL
jgi:hypothetical protein